MSNEMSLSESKCVLDPKPEQTEKVDATLKGEYNPNHIPRDVRDQIIANLSIENELLKKRLQEYSTAMRVAEGAIRKGFDQFAQFRGYQLY